ncbi:MAG: PKD domain-containing protein [Solirubrobacterales bacterium]|nr:PKD domain-containing protein [Solirubrobacterales bacterium]
MARFALALLSALITLSVTSAGATADSSSNVLVSATVYTSTGNSSDSVTLAALQADPGRCPTYTGPGTMNELGRQGFVDVPLPPSGAQTGTWALSTALACMQTPIAVNAVQGITVLNLDGTPLTASGSQLGPPDLATPSDFSDSTETPVVEALGSSNQYDRPWRGNGDQNYLDEVQESQNSGQPAPISIEVFEGPMLTVKVTASRTSVPTGGVVTFHATVTGPGAAGLSYSWSFGGGAPGSSTPAPRVRFGNAGQYDVTVQVTDAAGGGGVGSIPVTVGGQAPTATGGHQRSGAGTSLTSHFPTGPRHSSGSHPGGPPGNSKHGASTGASPRTATSATPAQPQTTPVATATTPAATTARTPSPPLHLSRRATTPRPPLSPGRLSKPIPSPAPEGPVVAGRLISDVVPLAPGASPLVHVVPAALASAPPAQRGLRASLLPPIVAALAVVLLLALGAGRELGWRPVWRALRGAN